jgi:hypothetical protein
VDVHDQVVSRTVGVRDRIQCLCRTRGNECFGARVPLAREEDEVLGRTGTPNRRNDVLDSGRPDLDVLGFNR